jgi:hypothetical protein
MAAVGGQPKGQEGKTMTLLDKPASLVGLSPAMKTTSWLMLLVCALPAFLPSCEPSAPATAPIEAPWPVEGHAVG